jgi:predicted small lipoprotein YifL
MVVAHFSIPAALATILCLTACGKKSPWDLPANVTGRAVVEAVVEEGHRPFDVWPTTFLVKLGRSDPADLEYVRVPGWVDKGLMKESVGKRILVECYRETPADQCYASHFSYENHSVMP